MTFRAVLLGLLAAAFLSGVTYFNDFVLRQSHFVGSFLPISVFGGLIIFTLMVNPLLGRVNRRLAMRGPELAVIMAIVFAACYVPGRGMMHYFTTIQMLPHEYQETNIAWHNEKIVDEVVAKRMLADPSANRAEALGGFLTGLGKSGKHIGLSDIPWYAWRVSLGFWVPLLLSILFAMIGLSLVLHRQWSHHERLRYPIAMFAQSLLPQPGHAISSVLKNRIFWVTAAAVICIHTVNYAKRWYPQDMIEIPVIVDFRALAGKVPTFAKWGGGTDLLIFRVFFSAVGFAYLLSTDVSMSMGVAPYLYTYVAGVLTIWGVPVREGGLMSPRIEAFLHAGAYFAMFLSLLYIGRRYYFHVMRRSLMLGGEGAPADAVWGARVFLAGAILFAAQLVIVGLDWQLAALYTIGTVAIFIVVSRIVAETGLFYLHTYHFPCVVLWGFMGAAAVGPQMMMIMMLVSAVLLIDPREALLPFMMNALQLVDRNKVKIGKTASWAALSLVVAFAVAIPATLYWQYDKGIETVSDGWCRYGPPFYPINEVMLAREALPNDELARAESLSGWQRFAEMSPKTSCVVAFAVAAGLVFLTTAARLRFARWPIHPVMFLVLATHQSRNLGGSFLLGGLIKIAVLRLFGSKAYEKVKPAMFGLVAGDMLGGGVTMIIGAIHYFSYGTSPKDYLILPW